MAYPLTSGPWASQPSRSVTVLTVLVMAMLLRSTYMQLVLHACVCHLAAGHHSQQGVRRCHESLSGL